MMDDDWDDDFVDLDGYGCEATGDRSLDEFGDRSPRWPSETQRRQAQQARDREQRRNSTRAIRDAEIERNKAETKRRNAERRGKPEPPAESHNGPAATWHIAGIRLQTPRPGHWVARAIRWPRSQGDKAHVGWPAVTRY
jgi:hypothetical protein